MANTKHNSVELEDRILWADGESTVDSSRIVETLMAGMSVAGLCVNEITPDIQQYNKFANGASQISTKESLKPLEYDWNIPQEYAELDVFEFLTTQTDFDASAPDAKLKLQRILNELSIYEELDLMPILRVLIYIINTLNRNNIMWGVGRGSSVSSYVLYLIGVHDIDSVRYELDITDFLRTA